MKCRTYILRDDPRPLPRADEMYTIRTRREIENQLGTLDAYATGAFHFRTEPGTYHQFSQTIHRVSNPFPPSRGMVYRA